MIKFLALAFRYCRRLGFFTGLIIFFKLKILRSKKIFLRTVGIPIFIRPGTSDVDTFEEIFLNGIYNLDYKVDPKVIIDLGGNIGLASIYFAKRFPNSIIITLEPNSSNFAQLLANTRGLKNIKPLNFAIGPKGGLGTTEIKRQNDFSGVQVKYTEQGYSLNDYAESETIKFLTVNDILEDFNLKAVSILKIDIEGFESELFSYDNLQWLNLVDSIIIETHDRFKPGSTRSVLRRIINSHFDISLAKGGLLFTKENLLPNEK